MVRLDIAFAVSVVSQFMSAPTVKHWVVSEQILCYLKGTPGLGILFSDFGHTHMEYYLNADWAESIGYRRSTSNYCIFVGGNLVPWKRKS